MIKLLTILGLLAGFSTAALADQDSDNFLATALINRGIQAQVAEFNQLVANVNSVKIGAAEDADTIVLEGMVIREGDIACGDATLTIKRSFQPPASGFGPGVMVFSAVVTKNLAPGCK